MKIDIARRPSASCRPREINVTMPSGQLRLVDKSVEQQALEKGRVECLGMRFDTEDVWRSCFTKGLIEKLADPGFRKTPGFPEGLRRCMIRMPDPPWFTACPNPFLAV